MYRETSQNSNKRLLFVLLLAVGGILIASSFRLIYTLSFSWAWELGILFFLVLIVHLILKRFATVYDYLLIDRKIMIIKILGRNEKPELLVNLTDIKDIYAYTDMPKEYEHYYKSESYSPFQRQNSIFVLYLENNEEKAFFFKPSEMFIEVLYNEMRSAHMSHSFEKKNVSEIIA